LDAPTSKFDLADNAMIIDYTGASPLAKVRSYLISGRGATGMGSETWTGFGLDSSVAAQDVFQYSIGYAENSDLPFGSYSVFAGQQVDSTAVLITYTRSADANLDGIVDDLDAAAVCTYWGDKGFGQWYYGDFNYTGSPDDVSRLVTFYNPSAAVPKSIARSDESVPAPSRGLYDYVTAPADDITAMNNVQVI
jgi:hypothetical protein